MSDEVIYSLLQKELVSVTFQEKRCAAGDPFTVQRNQGFVSSSLLIKIN